MGEIGGWYVLCPKCRALSKGGDWYERHTNVVVVKAFLLEMEDRLKKEVRVEADFQDECVEDKTRDTAWHDPCGFETAEWNTEDFVVYIEGKRIVGWGMYWDYHLDELWRIAKETGLEVDGGSEDGRKGVHY